jgi:hypothetical protein
MTTHPSPLTHVHSSREGVPLQPSLLTLGIASAMIVAIATLFITVIGVAYIGF